MCYEKLAILNQESCISPPYYFYFWKISWQQKGVKVVLMLKMARLEKFKQEGLKLFPCYFKGRKDIILISSKSCSNFNAV